MTTTVRTDERTKFLMDMLTGAIESHPYNFFRVGEYAPDEGYAVITETVWDDVTDNETFRVDLDTIEKGLRVIRESVLRGVVRRGELVEELVNAETGEPLMLSEELKRAIVAADLANDAAGSPDEANLDVVAYLAVLECGLYGAVLYS